MNLCGIPAASERFPRGTEPMRFDPRELLIRPIDELLEIESGQPGVLEL